MRLHDTVPDFAVPHVIERETTRVITRVPAPIKPPPKCLDKTAPARRIP